MPTEESAPPRPPAGSILPALMDVIADRKRAAGAGTPSYVAKLLAGGVPAIGAKVIEEAAEVVETADEPGQEGADHLVREVADLVFHTLVLLGHKEIAWQAVEAELARRFGVSGITEKASRPPKPAVKSSVKGRSKSKAKEKPTPLLPEEPTEQAPSPPPTLSPMPMPTPTPGSKPKPTPPWL